MKPTTLLWCATVVAACANLATPNPDEARRLAEARALLDQDPVQALDLAEQLLVQNPSLRDARLVAAEGSLRLARAGRGRTQLHLVDAATNFQKALAGVDDADAPAPLLLLAECHHELGEFEAGAATARRAAAGFAAAGDAGRRDAAAAMLLAGRCELQRFVAARQAELDAGGTAAKVPFGREAAGLATAAGACLQAARRELPAEAVPQLALLYQWLEQPGEVTRELERAVREWPQEVALHDAYQAWMRDQGQQDAMVGAYARMVREAASVPVVRWHQGRALYARADRLRADGNFAGALAAYERADAAFADYGGQVPAHAADVGQWRALCSLARARVAIDGGDLPLAQRELLLAPERSPRAIEYTDGAPALYDSFGGHFTGTAFAIHRALADSGDDALARTLAFNEELLRRHPDRFGFVYNNAALAARDLGVQRANAGDAAGARELWERSYAHYERAVALTPDDPRIVNDCGLMLVYHLDRDLERARALFDRAIELGRQQLEALPADADPRERERLEEAVGDAYQNIAVMLREQQRQPFAAYRQFCEEAVKYYPYQRREAAALLRSGGAVDLGSTARGALAQRLGDPQGGAAEALARVRPEVDRKVAAEDYDAALALLDGIVKECRDHGPFQLLRGELTLQLALQARTAGRRGVELLFQDAVTALQRAVELDSEPAGPRQLLATAQYEGGDLEGAVRTLSALLLHLQSQGGGKPDELLAAHTLRANAAARAYAQKRQESQADDQELLAAARASFRLLEDKGRLDAPLRQLWSATEQWAGAGAEAVNVHARALQRTPDDQTLLAAVVDTAGSTGQLGLAVELLSSRRDATGLWYLGKARYWFADAERQAGRTAEAQRLLDEARTAFAASMQQNADYRDSCEQWIAMVLGKKGNIAFWSDDLRAAETLLLEAARLRPDRIGEDLGLAETTKTGIMRVADKHFRQNDLARVEAIYRAASDAANSDLDLLNNSGLFARDHGNELERAGKRQEAIGMYEQSYKAYRRAQQLDPQNVRLRNDCALIAIYHLERDWELSRQLLDGAIADGERQLRDDPPADPEARQQLDEAVGDCYENLALWHLKHSKDAAAAKAAALQSQRHHPGERRPGARRHLQAAERLSSGK